MSTRGTTSNLNRWVDDNHPDTVQLMCKASRCLPTPSLLKRFIYFPIVAFASITLLPALAGYFAILILDPAKSRALKVQQQASKTAMGVAMLRDMMFNSNMGSDYMASMFLDRTSLLVDWIIGFYSRLTGRMLELGRLRLGYVFSFFIFLLLFWMMKVNATKQMNIYA